MTTLVNPPAPEPQLVTDLHQSPDDLLAGLVNVVNSFVTLEIGVTLYLGGSIVSGLLISGRSYFDQLSARVTESGSPDDPVRRALADLFRARAEGYPREEETADNTDRDEPSDDTEHVRPAGYIHLRAVTVHSPGIGEPLEQGLWRGRLTQIAGWSLGNFGSQPPLNDEKH